MCFGSKSYLVADSRLSFVTDFDQKSMKTDDFAPSEADFLEANLEGVYDDTSLLGDETAIDEEFSEENVALYIESAKGKPCLLLNGFKYRKAYRAKNGWRWNCSKNKNCLAYLYMSDNEEITKCHEVHDHPMDEKLENVVGKILLMDLDSHKLLNKISL